MRIVPAILLFPVAVFATGTVAESPGKPFPPATLQGFFGKDAEAEVSLKNPSTGKSVWLKVGDNFDGWKLTKLDAASGRATFSRGNESKEIRLAVEVPRLPELKPLFEDSVALRRMIAVLRRNGRARMAFAKMAQDLIKETNDMMKIAHPEWSFDEYGSFKKPGADVSEEVIARQAFTKAYEQRLHDYFAQNTDPDVALFREAYVAQVQASIAVPYGKAEFNAMKVRAENPDDRVANDTMNVYAHKLYAEADRRYLAAGGTTSLDDLPPEPPPPPSSPDHDE